jgi:ankyrin repeat protein
LIAAALFGHYEAAAVLVRNGANIDRRGCGGFTALLLAVRGGHIETVKLLLEAGADVNIHQGEDAFGLAERNKRGAIRELLEKARKSN